MSRESLPESSGSKAGWILLGGAALLAAGSVGYNIYGGDEGESTTQIVDNAPPSIEELREAAEASSDDAAPWAELGFAYFGSEQYALSAQAYQRAVEIDGNEAVLWSALGEALTYAADESVLDADPLPAESLAAFQKALELDPSDPRARYFLAVRQDLDGDHEGAITSWLALLTDTPPGAPWENELVRTIQQVGAANQIDIDDRLEEVMQARAPQVMIPGSGSAAGQAASSDLRGPTDQQIADASRMAPGEQRTMAVGMVESLEARLENEPQNLNGWVMLMRSRMTLGEPAKASAALADAIAANPGEEAELRRQAEILGVQ